MRERAAWRARAERVFRRGRCDGSRRSGLERGAAGREHSQAAARRRGRSAGGEGWGADATAAPSTARGGVARRGGRRGLRRWGAGWRGRRGSAGGVSRCDSVRRDVRSANYGLAGLSRRRRSAGRSRHGRPARERPGHRQRQAPGSAARAFRKRHEIDFGENGFKDTATDSKNDKDSKDSDSPFSSLQFSGNKGPVDIKSDTLDLDYKGNVVTFRGHVHAVQADATLTSDTLTVTYGKDFHEVQKMVANDNVRMSQGTRWATGDHAVLDQAKHTVTLTGSPVVHDGEDQVTGSKITVHLDTGKSEVEGARAVFFPKDKKTRDNKTTVAKSP